MSEAETMNPLSKGKAVAGFGKTNTMMWISVSLVIHIALIGGTSVPYIMDRWIDPDAAVARKAAAEAEAAKKKAEAKAAASGKPLTPPVGPGNGAATAPSTGPKLTPDEAAKADTPVMKRITETAKPEDMPKKPDDLGLSIDETNKSK
jgi:hypothetical protein